MKFLFINLGEGSVPHGSGGTERISNIAKEFRVANHKCEFLGTIGLKRFLEFRKVEVKVNIIRLPNFLLRERSKFHRLLTYFWASLKIPKSLKGLSCDIVYSASDFFPDVFGSIWCKRNRFSCRWVAIIHHEAKLNRVNIFTTFSSSIIVLLQKFSWYLISKKADLVLFYDSNEGRAISKKNFFKGKKLGFVRNGIDFGLILEAKPSDLSLDILLCGGPRQSKGVMDIPPLLNLIKHRFPKVTVGIAGHGTDKVIAALTLELKAIGMESNVIFLGNLSKMILYSIMKSARMILSLSYEEGWGIAMREGIACGRPCVAYRLPAFDSLERHLTFVELGDFEAMSTEVINLLSTKKLKNERLDVFMGESWSNVARQELSLILDNL